MEGISEYNQIGNTEEEIDIVAIEQISMFEGLIGQNYDTIVKAEDIIADLGNKLKNAPPFVSLAIKAQTKILKDLIKMLESQISDMTVVISKQKKI